MRQKDVENSNPFFTVEREELIRKDGIDTGYDALYRYDDASQLSVVSRGYKLVPHREAVDFVTHVLDDVGIEERKATFEMASNGAKMFMTIKFPEYEFNPASDAVKSTSLDSINSGNDGFIPQVIVRNSYDKSTTLDIMYGAYRLACSNGVLIGQTVQETKVTHFGKDIDLEVLRMPLIENLEKTIDGISRNFERLNREDGNPYLETILMQGMLVGKYERLLIGNLLEYAKVDYDVDEETQKQVVSGVRSTGKEMTAYMLWCVITELATHRVRSVIARQRMSVQIAQTFLK